MHLLGKIPQFGFRRISEMRDPAHRRAAFATLGDLANGRRLAFVCTLFSVNKSGLAQSEASSSTKKFMLKRAVLFLALVCTLGAATESPTFLFKRLALADSEAAVLAIKPDDSSPAILYVQGIPLLQQPDFEKTVAPFIGKPIGSELLNSLSNAIGAYAKAHDRLLTSVVIPNQNVGDGTVRLVVVFGRYKDIAVRGNRWFSSKLIQERMGVKPGDEVRLSVLESAVNWANTNPFRQVKVLVNPIANQPGKADLIIGVQEAAPWRVSGSVDNWGNVVLGEWHYAAAVQLGNLWGVDHQGSYQFITTDDIHRYQVHALNYRAPLPWRHFLEFGASYVRVNAPVGPALTQTGRNESANLKYIVPVRGGDQPVELHVGVDFKRGNNDYEFGGTSQLPTNVDTIQLTSGATVVRRDKRGATAFVANLNFSPGHLDAHNDTATYHTGRLGSNPTYVYGGLTVQRLTNLGRGWDLTNRLTTQLASTNLQGSEQLAAGGPTSVRGFNTNVFASDEGFVLSNDLLSPSITTPLQRFSKKFPPLETRFAVFYDAAQLWRHHVVIEDFAIAPIASAGLGLRMSVANNFSLNFDYGWQITRMPAIYKNTEHGHGHIKVVLAF
jgi:hemolysin activation/secretion protein